MEAVAVQSLAFPRIAGVAVDGVRGRQVCLKVADISLIPDVLHERGESRGQARKCHGACVLRSRLAVNNEPPAQDTVPGLGGFAAEREGFEPSVDLHLQRFSRPPHSTTLPPLRYALTSIRPSGNRCLKPSTTELREAVQRELLRQVPTQTTVPTCFLSHFLPRRMLRRPLLYERQSRAS